MPRQSETPVAKEVIDLFAPTAPTEPTEEQLTYVSNRCFINHLDTFNNIEILNNLADITFVEFNKTGKSISEENEEEEEEEGVEEEDDDVTQTASGTRDIKIKKQWQIIGTVQQKKVKNLDGVYEIIKFEQTNEFVTRLFKCSVVIFDITNDPEEIAIANWVIDEFQKRLEQMNEESPKQFKLLQELRVFIIISTIMTWALTKPLNPYDPSLPFQETDYRKRKPHPNYKLHTNLEKKVVKIGKIFPSKFKTLVIASGIVYGLAENDLSYLFEWAWLNNPKIMPIFGSGRNYIPLIHVKDLANIVVAIIQNLSKLSRQYILAVEQQLSKFRSIIKAVCKTMGTGEVINVITEEAFLYPEINQTVYERFSVNLTMEPGYIINNLGIVWQSDLSLPQNVLSICNEFKDARKLAPIKIIMHGPPAVGKTLIAKRLCEHYKLTYMNVKTVIDETIEFLEEAIQKAEAEQLAAEAEKDEEEEEEEDDETDRDEKPSMDDYKNQLEEITKEKNEQKSGKISTELVTKLIKQKMYTNKLLNQGWVLDGYPKTLDEARELFGLDNDDDDDALDEEEGESAHVNKVIMPQFVISLMATDEFLCDRVMNLPESEIQDTHYTESHMLRRIEEFRLNNTDEDTVLNFYDEAEIHPELIETMQDDDPNMEPTFNKVCEIVGKHRHLGPSKAELEELERLAEIKRIENEERMKKEKEELEQNLKNERLLKMENWAEMMLEIEKEEAEVLAIQGIPLRNYLVKYIFPTLTKGLLEVAKLKPNDPIDFLAEYLFKENPEGRMFDPAYTAAAGVFMDAVQQLQDVVAGNKDELGTLRQFVDNNNTDVDHT